MLFMLGFWVTGFMGVAGICMSIAWLAHIAVYMLPPVPLYPMLNNLFVVLDNVFSLFGVAAFAAFCLYFMGGWLWSGSATWLHVMCDVGVAVQ